MKDCAVFLVIAGVSSALLWIAVQRARLRRRRLEVRRRLALDAVNNAPAVRFWNAQR